MSEDTVTFGRIEVGKILDVDIETIFFLHHSCDEWIIGDLKSAKKFLSDLTEAIKYYEENI